MNEWQQHYAHNSEHGIQASIWVSWWLSGELFYTPFSANEQNEMDEVAESLGLSQCQYIINGVSLTQL